MGAVLAAKLKEGWSKMAGFMKKMFRGMETPAEEKKEAKALKSGKITPKQYVAGEKAEGHGAGAAKKAAAIKSGKLSPAKYAAEHAAKKPAAKKMACGGKAKATKKMCGGGATKMVKMAKGGGVETKGKTKGRMV